MNALHIHGLLMALTRDGYVELPYWEEKNHFRFHYEDGMLVIFPDQGKGRPIHVGPGVFEAVCERYSSLPEDRRGTAEFSKNWPECPDAVACPFVGRVIQFLETGV